jgi:hypothetical protein
MARGKTMKRKGSKKGKTRKMTPWNKLVMETFRKMRAANKGAKFSDALKEAAKLKKQGKSAN